VTGRPSTGRRRCLFAAPAFLAACSSSGRNVIDSTRFEPAQLVKGDIDRVAETHQQDILAALQRLAEKLYRRNPRQWARGGATSMSMALANLQIFPAPAWDSLNGARGAAAIQRAFAADHEGDRVLALIGGLRTMVDDAFEGKRAFYLLDDLNEQKLYNCARNVEIAVWMLANRRDTGGALWLLSNEIDGPARNLSFEREFGRIIGSLDVLARIIATKNARTITRIVQNLATAVFLPI
jgi:hypothetical protein